LGGGGNYKSGEMKKSEEIMRNHEKSGEIKKKQMESKKRQMKSKSLFLFILI